MCINPNLDLVKINVYAKFDQIQKFEWKQNCENNQKP